MMRIFASLIFTCNTVTSFYTSTPLTIPPFNPVLKNSKRCSVKLKAREGNGDNKDDVNPISKDAEQLLNLAKLMDDDDDLSVHDLVAETEAILKEANDALLEASEEDKTKEDVVEEDPISKDAEQLLNLAKLMDDDDDLSVHDLVAETEAILKEANDALLEASEEDKMKEDVIEEDPISKEAEQLLNLAKLMDDDDDLSVHDIVAETEAILKEANDALLEASEEDKMKEDVVEEDPISKEAEQLLNLAKLMDENDDLSVHDIVAETDAILKEANDALQEARQIDENNESANEQSEIEITTPVFSAEEAQDLISKSSSGKISSKDLEDEVHKRKQYKARVPQSGKAFSFSVSNLVGATADAAADAVSKKMNEIKKEVQSIPSRTSQKISDTVTNAADSATKRIQAIPMEIEGVVQRKLDEVTEEVKSIPSKAQEAMKDATQKAVNEVVSTPGRVVEGTKKAVVDTVKKTQNDIVQSIDDTKKAIEDTVDEITNIPTKTLTELNEIMTSNMQNEMLSRSGSDTSGQTIKEETTQESLKEETPKDSKKFDLGISIPMTELSISRMIQSNENQRYIMSNEGEKGVEITGKKPVLDQNRNKSSGTRPIFQSKKKSASLSNNFGKSSGTKPISLPKKSAPAFPMIGFLSENGSSSSTPASVQILKRAPRGVATIIEWEQNRDGSISGIIKGSSNYVEGGKILTSPIEGTPIERTVVTTQSGSQYYLEKQRSESISREEVEERKRLLQIAARGKRAGRKSVTMKSNEQFSNEKSGSKSNNLFSTTLSLFGLGDKDQNADKDHELSKEYKIEKKRLAAKLRAEARKKEAEKKRKASQLVLEARRKELEKKRKAATEAREKELTEKRAALEAREKELTKKRAALEARKKEAQAEAENKKSLGRSVKGKTRSPTFNLLGFGSDGNEESEEELSTSIPTNKVVKVSKKMIAPRGMATIVDWKQNRDGSISGIIKGSSNYVEGGKILTSPIQGKAVGGFVVTTGSGSKYFLEETPVSVPIESGSRSKQIVTKISSSKRLSRSSSKIDISGTNPNRAPAGVPTITNWRRNLNGTISGYVEGAKGFDGEKITTSKIRGTPKKGTVVYTSSGSIYYLE